MSTKKSAVVSTSTVNGQRLIKVLMPKVPQKSKFWKIKKISFFQNSKIQLFYYLNVDRWRQRRPRNQLSGWLSTSTAAFFSVDSRQPFSSPPCSHAGFCFHGIKASLWMIIFTIFFTSTLVEFLKPKFVKLSTHFWVRSPTSYGNIVVQTQSQWCHSSQTKSVTANCMINSKQVFSRHLRRCIG